MVVVCGVLEVVLGCVAVLVPGWAAGAVAVGGAAVVVGVAVPGGAVVVCGGGAAVGGGAAWRVLWAAAHVAQLNMRKNERIRVVINVSDEESFRPSVRGGTLTFSLKLQVESRYPGNPVACKRGVRGDYF